MKTRSAKAKGKRLEKYVRDMLLKVYPSLTEEDVRITVGAETGADVKLTAKACQAFPYSVECKNREAFGTIYKFYEQALSNLTANTKHGLLVIKMNNKAPLAIIDADHFFSLKDKNNNG